MYFKVIAISGKKPSHDASHTTDFSRAGLVVDSDGVDEKCYVINIRQYNNMRTQLKTEKSLIA